MQHSLSPMTNDDRISLHRLCVWKATGWNSDSFRARDCRRDQLRRLPVVVVLSEKYRSL
jgi:hypothetical protein